MKKKKKAQKYTFSTRKISMMPFFFKARDFSMWEGERWGWELKGGFPPPRPPVIPARYHRSRNTKKPLPPNTEIHIFSSTPFVFNGHDPSFSPPPQPQAHSFLNHGFLKGEIVGGLGELDWKEGWGCSPPPPQSVLDVKSP